MEFGSIRFKPGLWPTAAALILVPALASLGFWQLDRAEQKRALLDAMDEWAHASATDISEIDLAASSSQFRPVTAEGFYLVEPQWLLDNRVYRGRVGYDVITLLHLDREPGALLVNRGWVPGGYDRSRLPDISVEPRRRTLRGRLSPPPSVGLQLGSSPSADGSVRVIERLSPSDIGRSLGMDVGPLILLLDADQEDGYGRDWHGAAPVFGPDRHRGYAATWFSLAAAVVVIYLIVNLRRERGFPGDGIDSTRHKVN